MAYELTKEFVTKLVNQPITDFEVSEGAGATDNVAGELKALKVQTAQGDTLNLVHKTFPSDPMGKIFMADGGGFRVENTFYEEVAPLIENLVTARAPSNYKLPIPKVYASFNNDCDDYLTMEDLRPQGYKMADKFVGLNLCETKLLLQQLGRFHAFTYFLLKHEGEKIFERFPHLKELKFMSPEKLGEMMMMIDGAVKYTQEIIEARDSKLGQRYAEMLKKNDHHKLFDQTRGDTDKKYFPVIIHGDIWLNNALYKYDANGNPTDIRFIDFQLTRRGNIFEDLKYFFHTSTTPEFRRKHLYVALDAYYNAFAGALADIKVPLPIGFSRGFLIDEFEANRLSGYIFMGFALPMQMGNDPKASMGPPEGGPAQELPPGFNPMDLPAEVRMGGFVANLRVQLETSERAVQRLMDLTQEMADLQLL